ncbi:MAG TPA: metalloregulator ArsR/SmtB family transcription factor [Candidatus Bathyarchaeia archaeon]|nr:metalloregulator ArsR/SmtB family transcription factor [Candidatus Bathyarchaeia archaeon]
MYKAKIDMNVFEFQADLSKTMANPLRLAILHFLKDGEKKVNELSELIGVSQSNVSQHLALMRQRQIVKTRKLGTNIYYSVSNPKISQACDMVREVLIEQLRQKQELIKNYPV